MSLAALAEQEGMKPKLAKTVGEWLAEHPALVEEIHECRERGHSWANIHKLLRQHYGFPFTSWTGLRDEFSK